MVTMAKQINISIISYCCPFFCVPRTAKICSYRKGKKKTNPKYNVILLTALLWKLLSPAQLVLLPSDLPLSVPSCPPPIFTSTAARDGL